MRKLFLAAVVLGLVAVACGGAQEPVDLTAPPPPTEATTTTAALAVTSSTTSLVITTSSSLAGTTTSTATTTASETTSTTATSDPTTTAPPPATSTTTASGTTSTTAVSETTTTTTLPPTTTTTLAPLSSLAYRLVAEVPFPIHFTPLPGTDRSVIAAKEGTLWVWDGEELRPDPLLDIRSLVRNQGEQGLLGMAFAPDFTQSRRMFLHYTDNNGGTVLAEYAVTGLTADPDSALVLWQVDQPASNHNGGTIEFGPDGYLYFGLGDGGGANDRFGHGQNDQSPLAALLRLDVSTPGVARPAPGNPFPAPEVWSIGLRNPWRFTIDAPTGLVIIADVGQNSFEEISLAPIAAPGLNYGWPITEGLHCFRPQSECDTEGLILPVVELKHGDGNTCSVTGGVVYRGQAIPELFGHYLFSDYCGGYLRSFPLERPTEPPTDWTSQVGVPGAVVAFGVDGAGEVYVMTSQGQVLALTAQR